MAPRVAFLVGLAASFSAAADVATLTNTSCDVVVDWATTTGLILVEPSIQVVSQHLLLRSQNAETPSNNSTYINSWAAVSDLAVRNARFAGWFPYAKAGVAELDPPSGSALCGPSVWAQGQTLPLTLNCSAYGGIATVEFASFGTAGGACGAYTIDATCHDSASLTIVQHACVQQPWCTLPPALFNLSASGCGAGVAPYLAVQVQCADPRARHTYWDFTAVDSLFLDFWRAVGADNGSRPIVSFSTAPTWLYSGTSDASQFSYVDDPTVPWYGYNRGIAPALNGSDLGAYYGRLAAWYARGGFADEYGTRLFSGHALNFTSPAGVAAGLAATALARSGPADEPADDEWRARLGLTGGGGGVIWEVGNEVDYEHGHTPQSYTADFDAIVMGVRQALGIGAGGRDGGSYDGGPLDGSSNNDSPAIRHAADTPTESVAGPEVASFVRSAGPLVAGGRSAVFSGTAASVEEDYTPAPLATNSEALLPLDALLFNGMNLPNIDNTSVVVEWARYFLNASNHHPAVRDAAALAYIGYHAYPTQGGFTPDPDTFSGMFTYVDDLFLPKVLAVDAIIRELSPNTLTLLDECGVDMDGVLDPSLPPPANNPRFWVASGAYFAYLYARVAGLPNSTVRVLGHSQIMDAPGQEPSVSLLDWSSGNGTAAYWVTWLIIRAFSPGVDNLVTTNVTASSVLPDTVRRKDLPQESSRSTTAGIFAQAYWHTPQAGRPTLPGSAPGNVRRQRMLLVNTVNAFSVVSMPPPATLVRSGARRTAAVGFGPTTARGSVGNVGCTSWVVDERTGLGAPLQLDCSTRSDQGAGEAPGFELQLFPYATAVLEFS